MPTSSQAQPAKLGRRRSSAVAAALSFCYRVLTAMGYRDPRSTCRIHLNLLSRQEPNTVAGPPAASSAARRWQWPPAQRQSLPRLTSTRHGSRFAEDALALGAGTSRRRLSVQPDDPSTPASLSDSVNLIDELASCPRCTFPCIARIGSSYSFLSSASISQLLDCFNTYISASSRPRWRGKPYLGS